MKITTKRKMIPVLLLAALLAVLAALTACDDASDGGDGALETVPYVNVYVPYKDVLVTVQYDESRGQLKELRETLNAALVMAGHTVTDEVFYGVFDMAEGGSIIYNAEGILHGDYQFTNGITLFARFETNESAQSARTKSLVFNGWPKDSVNKEVFSRMTVTEGENVTRFTPVSFVPNGEAFAGWAEAESGRLVTTRDGRLLPDYDIWASEETEFYPKLVPGRVNRCFLHLEGDTVAFEYSSNLNATAVLPTDERDGRGIIGWSTDPKAKYPSDITYPTYLGSKKAYLYVKEGEHYYPVYSEYKDVTFIYGDKEETERWYRYYPEGNEWGGQLYWDVTETKEIYLPYYYYDSQSGSKTVIAYRTERGEMLPVGSVPYEGLESRYYGIIKKSVSPARVYISDLGYENEYRYCLVNSAIELPNGKAEAYLRFLGWYLDAEGKSGRVLSLRTDENGKLYVTCEGSDKEISYSNNSCTLYAVYDYGGDAR